MFKEKEKLNDLNRENTKILNKLVEISKGKQGKLVRLLVLIYFVVCLWAVTDSGKETH